MPDGNKGSAIQIDLSIEDSRWEGLELGAWPDLQALCEAAIAAALQHVRTKLAKNTELSILFASDSEIRELNRNWRQQDKPTNVLSFPAVTPDKLKKTPVLGDLALAFETIEKEALADEKRFRDHTSHLIIHGFLHILGFDHQTVSDAERMEAVEIAALASLNITNPYANTDLLTSQSQGI